MDSPHKKNYYKEGTPPPLSSLIVSRSTFHSDYSLIGPRQRGPKQRESLLMTLRQITLREPQREVSSGLLQDLLPSQTILLWLVQEDLTQIPIEVQ